MNTDEGRPRKTSPGSFRKQNYWTTQTKQDPPPWYLWDSKLPLTRSRSETHLPVKPKPPPLCDPADLGRDVSDYLLSSTLHGLRYIGEKKLTWLERFFWLAAFGSSLACAAFFIMNIYAKWRQSPMIVSINPESMPLKNLPFPALTICNVNQAKKSVAERYKEMGHTVDIKLLASLCSTEEVDDDIFGDTAANNADWDHFRRFLINVTQPCNEMLAQCIWNSKVESCTDLFNAQLTDEGLCCTFNAVHKDNMFWNPKILNDMNITFPSPPVDWTPEGGYPKDAPANGFPWRAKGVGTHHGLTLVIDANLDEYYCASTKSYGFKILLHNPAETPKIANLGEIYGPGRETRVQIEPRIMDAQSPLRSIAISKRLCFFSSESNLVFFKTYTLRNCEMECEARQMLSVCNCSLYYMPRGFCPIVDGCYGWNGTAEFFIRDGNLVSQSKLFVFIENRTTRVCGKGDAKCYTKVWRNQSLEEERECEECLPGCNEISYEARISSAPLNERLLGNYAKALGHTAEYFKTNMLIIHFYFENGRFHRYTKGEIFGLTEFLSNTGGLLGLCMGFSMMSAIELLYYCTLRALCKVRHRRLKPFTR